MGTKEYDNIQAALSKNEDAWRHGPRKIEVFAIQQFCGRVVEFAESLRQRTGRTFDEAQTNGPSPSLSSSSSFRQPPTSPPALSERVRNYQPIVGISQWPSCVDDNPDWAKLFGPRSKVNTGYDDDEEDGPWLTPRMAAKIHYIAIDDAHSLLEIHPRLPKIARPFFQKSRVWRLAFRDCYVRIGLRLQKGLPPNPNCTGEEMAFHNIMDRAPDAEDGLFSYEHYNSLPKYPNDDEFETVRDNVIEDDDVLMLFEPNDHGHDDSSDEGDNPDVDNPVLGPGSLASFMLGSGGEMMRSSNLHPKDWFLAFDKDPLQDHV